MRWSKGARKGELSPCMICGKDMFVKPWLKGIRLYCSHECQYESMRRSSVPTWITSHKGDMSPNWKGGKRIDKGYSLVWAKYHPYCNATGYIQEHRLVVEKVIGRYLDKKEIVHHINRNKLDNRPENLYLFPSNSAHRKFHLSYNRCKENIVSNLCS